MRPLAILAELAAHEQKFFPRLGKHVGKQQAQISKPLPLVSRHFADQRSLTVDDLIMAERQYEIFVERIQHSKRQLVVVILAMNRILTEVLKRVVHPSHVPLQPEPKSAQMRRPRNHGIRSRLFRVCLNIRMLFVRFEIKAPQKVDRFKVLASTELVWNPLAFLARVIQIKHGSHSIHPQPVGVILIQPEHGARQQKAAHFAASVIKNKSLPVRMKSLPCIRMLKQMRAVEKSQPVPIGREVRRNPIQNHRNVLLMQIIHEIHEILRRSVTRRR